MQLTQALKEWAIATQALETGKTILLLRKGGLREGSAFKVPYSRVWLYPTYEHQQPSLLKPEFAAQVKTVPSGWHPDTVSIGAWADITHVVAVTEAAVIAALLPLHIWNSQFVSERLTWKPQHSLSLLLLRTYQLPAPQVIPYRSEYGGCKSWINLATALKTSGSTPVFSTEEYSHQVAQVQAQCKPNEAMSPNSIENDIELGHSKEG